MLADLARRIDELRFVEGVEKVEHVPYGGGDQFWARFNRPLDLPKLTEIAKKHGCTVIPFATLPSKLPRGLAELLWDGVTHVITKKSDGWSNFTSKFGFEPDGIAKLAIDLHGPYTIFIATSEEGIQLLYDYLGLKYVPPAPPPPPPKPTVPAKPTPPMVKPSQPPPPRSTAPVSTPAQPAQSTNAKTEAEQTASQPAASSGQTSANPDAKKAEAKKETQSQAPA